MKTEIDAQTVKKLREETGAGMMNCKKALKIIMEIMKKQLNH
jgi:translation elongation factor EF-Ts